MNNLRRLLFILVLFPWLDFAIRLALPSFISSLWDEGFLFLIIVTVWWVKRNEPRYLAIPKKKIQWPILIFLLFCVSSIVVNVVPMAAGIDAMRVVFQPMFFVLITMYLLDDEKLLKRFIDWMIISAVLIAILGMIQYQFKIVNPNWVSVKDKAQFRIVSIFSNPNALAGYFNIMLAFAGALFLYVKDIKQKLLYLAACLPLGVGLLLTFSRGAWIGFAVMGLYFLWIWNKKWLLAVPVLAAVVPFILPSTLKEAIMNRLLDLVDPNYYKMSAEFGRISFWKDALNKIQENPIFGYGMGTYGDSVAIRHNIPFSQWVDNHYLKLGAEIGLIGLIAFLFLLGGLFYVTSQLLKRSESDIEKAILLGLNGVFIVMVFQNVTASIWEALSVAVYFYACIGILFALLWKDRQKGSSTT